MIVAYLAATSVLLLNQVLGRPLSSFVSSELLKRSNQAVTTPLPPSRDPFYAAPVGFEKAQPGAVLRVRVAPGNLTSITGNCSAVYNILYRTTDSLYRASWAITTLYVPSLAYAWENATNVTAAGKALLSYQFPYDSNDVDSSPSFAWYSGVPSDVSNSLGLGWHVNVPDYEGPLASFASGPQSGHATLDSVRAVTSSGFGLAPDARYAMWGYSGGAFASEWAAELQTQYAPELSFAGAALGGLPTNLSAFFETATDTSFAGLVPSILLGLSSQRPELRRYLLSRLKESGPYNRTGFLQAANQSFSANFVTFANQSVYDYFINGRADLSAPEVRRAFDTDSIIGYAGVPRMPLFVYKAIDDELAPTPPVDDMVDRYCAVGATIQYSRNTVGGHVAEDINGDGPAFDWLAGVLSGSLLPEGCSIRNVTWNVTTSEVLQTPQGQVG